MINWDEIIAPAKRENNTKRAFVAVNRLQGKHVPTAPGEALDMFAELAKVLQARYQERLLVIGFAETATAVALAVAQGLKCLSMTTTRENLPHVQYFYFSESHSHAMEQKLVREDLERAMGQVERIVIVEDEITTGNTILHLLRLLRQEYGAACPAMTAASLLNGMDEEAMALFAREQVDCVFLHKYTPAVYEKRMEQAVSEGKAWDLRGSSTDVPEIHIYEGNLELRRLQDAGEIARQCDGLLAVLERECSFAQGERVLVLGTEEFMYPALWIGRQLQQAGCQVWCHATTRSPIVPSPQEDYPLHSRWCLRSLYDEGRVTYLYNLTRYDSVLLLTDADTESAAGLADLTAALRQTGNERVRIVEWRRL